MEILGKLFGSPAKVKIMRLFLSNPDQAFDNQEISRRTKVTASNTRKEVLNLEKAGLVKKKSFFKEASGNRNGRPSKKRVSGWTLDPKFSYLEPLKNLLIRLNPIGQKDIKKRFEKAGKIQAVIISGVFIQEPESRVDMLIVGDKLKAPSVESVIKDIEAELGQEIKYSVFETDDFRYRMGIYDKLIRDILDFSHIKVIDRLGMEY